MSTAQLELQHVAEVIPAGLGHGWLCSCGIAQTDYLTDIAAADGATEHEELEAG